MQFFLGQLSLWNVMSFLHSGQQTWSWRSATPYSPGMKLIVQKSAQSQPPDSSSSWKLHLVLHGHLHCVLKLAWPLDFSSFCGHLIRLSSFLCLHTFFYPLASFLCFVLKHFPQTEFTSLLCCWCPVPLSIPSSCLGHCEFAASVYGWGSNAPLSWYSRKWPYRWILAAQTFSVKHINGLFSVFHVVLQNLLCCLPY